MLGALLIDFFFPNSSKNPEVEDRVCATSNNLKYLTREKEKKKRQGSPKAAMTQFIQFNNQVESLSLFRYSNPKLSFFFLF